MIVLVTGSRDWPVEQMVWSDLDALLRISRDRGEPFVLRHGFCRKGADQMADNWFMYQYYQGLVHLDGIQRRDAKWSQHGKAAGFIRNSEMVAEGADRCLAYRLNRSRGTTDCMDKAVEAGIPVTLTDLWIGQYVGEPIRKEG